MVMLDIQVKSGISNIELSNVRQETLHVNDPASPKGWLTSPSSTSIYNQHQ
jgi:hypothetical protein